MRTWGRTTDEFGNKTWVEVTTDANGLNDAVYLTTLIQVLKLNLGESPFYGNYGIPAYQTIMTQVYPDFYAARTQQQFASFFASLIIQRLKQVREPTYTVKATLHNNATVSVDVPV